MDVGGQKQLMAYAAAATAAQLDILPATVAKGGTAVETDGLVRGAAGAAAAGKRVGAALAAGAGDEPAAGDRFAADDRPPAGGLAAATAAATNTLLLTVATNGTPATAASALVALAWAAARKGAHGGGGCGDGGCCGGAEGSDPLLSDPARRAGGQGRVQVVAAGRLGRGGAVAGRRGVLPPCRYPLRPGRRRPRHRSRRHGAALQRRRDGCSGVGRRRGARGDR